MNGQERAAALVLAGKGVQVDDGHTYGVLAADLVAYGATIRALVAELDRVAPVCSCVEDVRCGPCMTGAVDPVTGTPPADDPLYRCTAHGHAGCASEFRDGEVWITHHPAPTSPADDVREALTTEEGYEAEKTCVLCLRDDVYEEAQPLSDNGVWLHLPGGEVICDRCGLASADAAQAARLGADVRTHGTVTRAEVDAALASLVDGSECYVGHTVAGVRAALEAAREVQS